MPEWTTTILLPVTPAVLLAVSDFRERRVSVTALAVFAACCAASAVISLGCKGAAVRTASGMAVLAVMLLLLRLWYVLSHGAGSQMLDTAFGKGDAAFLACTTMLLDTRSLCLFTAASCLAGIVWHRITGKVEIPFVGLAVPVLATSLTIIEFVKP